MLEEFVEPAPADSNSFTNFHTLRALPYPVSESTITGTDEGGFSWKIKNGLNDVGTCKEKM